MNALPVLKTCMLIVMIESVNKKKKENNWFEKQAKEMDIELDEDLYPFYLLALVSKGL
jgi:hypothetical protein